MKRLRLTAYAHGDDPGTRATIALAILRTESEMAEFIPPDPELPMHHACRVRLDELKRAERKRERERRKQT